MWWHKKEQEQDTTEHNMEIITPQEAEQNAILKDQTVYSKAQKDLLIPFAKWFNARVEDSVCTKGVLIIENRDIPSEYVDTYNRPYKDADGKMYFKHECRFKGLIVAYLERNNWEELFLLSDSTMVFYDINNKNNNDTMIQLFKVWFTDFTDYRCDYTEKHMLLWSFIPEVFLTNNAEQPFNDCISNYLVSQGCQAQKDGSTILIEPITKLTHEDKEQ